MGVRALIEGGVSELTFIGHETNISTDGTLFPHTDTEEGDLLILSDMVSTNSPLNTATPSGGWLEALSESYVDPVSSLLQTMRVHAVKATAGIISSGVLPLQTSSITPSIAGSARLYTYRPDEDITGITFSSNPLLTTGGAAVPLSHDVDSALAGAPVVVVNIAPSEGTAAFSGSPAFDETENSSIVKFSRKLFNSSPTDLTVSSTFNFKNFIASTWVSVY